MTQSRFSHALGEIRFRLQGGFRSLWNWTVDKVLDRQRDKQFGIESSQRHALEEWGLADPDRVDYQASSYRDLHALFQLLPIGKQDVFLDLGAGLGRVVCVAALQKFRSVIGVELSPELSRAAVANVERARPRFACPDVRVVQGAAEDFTIPQEVNLIYFFNPFRRAAMSRVLENVRQSVLEFPRPMQLIFYGTAASGEFRETVALQPWLTLSVARRLPTGAIALIYVAKPLSQE